MKAIRHHGDRALQALLGQRLRALRVATLAFLAGALLYLGHPGRVGILHVPLYTGLLYAAIVTPTAVLTAIWLPGLTAFSDAVQWVRLAFAAAVAAFPAFLRPLADQPAVLATIVVLGATALVAVQRRAAASGLAVA